MKIVYIAHPISGDIQANLADIRRIVRKINLADDVVVPFVPYYVDVVSMDDNMPAERAMGIANGIAIIESGMIDEMWLTGATISEGMATEKSLAEEMGITVIDKIGQL